MALEKLDHERWYLRWWRVPAVVHVGGEFDVLGSELLPQVARHSCTRSVDAELRLNKGNAALLVRERHNPIAPAHRHEHRTHWIGAQQPSRRLPGEVRRRRDAFPPLIQQQRRE